MKLHRVLLGALLAAVFAVGACGDSARDDCKDACDGTEQEIEACQRACDAIK